jgi:hypothetical protein
MEICIILLTWPINATRFYFRGFPRPALNDTASLNACWRVAPSVRFSLRPITAVLILLHRFSSLRFGLSPNLQADVRVDRYQAKWQPASVGVKVAR